MYISLFFKMLIAISAQEIVVEATSLSLDSDAHAKTRTVIVQSEIAKKSNLSVVDILRQVPGLDVARNGGAGQTAFIFIRGARSEDTLVLIDGVKVNDGSSPGGGYDFSNLSPYQIDRIEVYKGPQSVRFGSGALGGVVNIVTKSGGDQSLNYSLEGGTYDTQKVNLNYSSPKNRHMYSLGLDFDQTEGFSAAKKTGFAEADASENLGLSAKFDHRINSQTQAQSSFKYFEQEAEIDRSGGALGDDPNYLSENKQWVVGLKGERWFVADTFKSSLGYYFSDMERTNNNPADSGNSDVLTAQFLSDRHRAEWQNDWMISDKRTLQTGLHWEEEGADIDSEFNSVPESISNQKQETIGLFVAHTFSGRDWFNDVGLRYDSYQTQGGSSKVIPSYRAALGRRLKSKDGHVTLAYGSGYKTPTLYQLFSSFGNENLQKELSQSWELSLSESINSDLLFSFVLFTNNYKELIEFDFVSSKYQNLTRARAHGGEVSLHYQGLKNIKVQLSYNYLDAENKITGERLLRRARDSIQAEVSYQREKWDLRLSGRYKGPRDDVDPVSVNTVQLKEFTVIDLGVAREMSKEFKLTAQIENLFDSEYEEVSGYNTSGFAVFFGFKGEI